MLDKLWNLEEYSWDKIVPIEPPIKCYCCPNLD